MPQPHAFPRHFLYIDHFLFLNASSQIGGRHKAQNQVAVGTPSGHTVKQPLNGSELPRGCTFLLLPFLLVGFRRKDVKEFFISNGFIFLSVWRKALSHEGRERKKEEKEK